MRQPSPQQPLAEARRFRPQLEALEERCNPAVHTTVVGSALVVVSRGAHDRIAIVDNGATAVNNVVLVNNGALFVPNVAVTLVVVRTRAGNDSVSYLLTSHLVAGAMRNILVNLGTGVNTFKATLAGGLDARSTLNIQATGGAQDRLSFDASGNINLASTSTLTVTLAGGFNPNNITANYLGQDGGLFVFLAKGGLSADLIDAQFTMLTGSNGQLSAQEFGGAGNDNLTLSVIQANAFDRLAVNATVDGGAGINRSFTTANVTTTHTVNFPL